MSTYTPTRSHRRPATPPPTRAERRAAAPSATPGAVVAIAPEASPAFREGPFSTWRWRREVARSLAAVRRDGPAPWLARARGRWLVAVLALVGALLLTQAILTVVWQDPVTAVVHARAQYRLAGELADLEAAGEPQAPLPGLDGGTVLALLPVGRAGALLRRRPAAVRVPADPALVGAATDWRRRALTLARRPAGRALGRVRIPSIGLSNVLVQGVGHPQLADGPGHYPGTSLPGLGGTIGLAGHRTTYGAPFRHLDALHRGSRITLEMPYATFDYAVQSTRIVRPSATGVLDPPASGERLVLTTCNPLYSAAQRLIVTARLIRTRAPA